MAWNPLAFRSPQATFWLVAVYITLFTSVVYFHLHVPSAPLKWSQLPSGVNLTEAWLDLKELSNGFHPYNSHRNDEVRSFLLRKVNGILDRNDASSVTVGSSKSVDLTSKSVVVYDDLVSNATFSNGNVTVYFEGTNIIICVIGSEDNSTSDVLVNAHYDSVSTGFGVTDDGMGIVSILQLISHFTRTANKPKRSITFLLNNGEEDFLNGAWAFMRHPVSKSPHIFLNLEGAGAGGKAVLFRSTDTEVTRFYKKAAHPTGSVLTADGFKYRLVRSETDYAVFNGAYGMRGLDVAFFNPRSRYHTIDDSTKFDSVDSLWNMLDAALTVVQGMVSDTSTGFDGDSIDEGQIAAGHGTDAVWFDILSNAFALLRLHTLFALSVTLLVVSPLVLIALHVALVRSDKWYPFSNRVAFGHDDDHYSIKLYGMRGFFRFPVAFVLSTTVVLALAFLQTKVNQFLVYSSEYAVWSSFLSVVLLIDWFIFYGAYQMRPTALARFYSLAWSYALLWVLAVATTVSENNFKLAGGYFIIIYLAATFLALLISYIEFFALPKKQKYAEDQVNPSVESDHSEANEDRNDGDEPTERTSLLRGERHTFSGGYGGRSSQHGALARITGLDSDEQAWSTNLPSSTWLVQFLLLAPINVILVGELGLYLTTALHQTPADGNSTLTIYLLIALLSILVINPLRPFLHKLSPYIPLVILLVFAGTLAYNLLAFPFSVDAKLKVYFLQRIDLDAGTNSVSLTGLDGYLQDIISELPSAAGQTLNCSTSPLRARDGLKACSWSGLPPNVASSSSAATSSSESTTTSSTLLADEAAAKHRYADWLTYNVTTPKNASDTAIFTVRALNSRACALRFSRPAAAVHVAGSGAPDPHMPATGAHGASEVRLWHRDWDREWEVRVRWDGGDGVDGSAKGAIGVSGSVVCMWSDANVPGVIPALDEVWRYMPAWAMVTKGADGLVEGSKAFEI